MKEKYMKIALKEAEKSFYKKEVPVGCVIVNNDKIIAKAHNLKEKKNSSLAHAELIAIAKANKKMKNWRLNDCDIYITMEPCPMCASAIKQSRISNVYYGVKNENNKESRLILESVDINNNISVESGLLEKECKVLVQDFFKEKRNDDF